MKRGREPHARRKLLKSHRREDKAAKDSSPIEGDKIINIRNRQRVCSVDLRLLRAIASHYLSESLLLANYDLTLNVVNADEMTRLNETRLRHAGSTDVITFDYSIPGPEPIVAGEIFVCVDEALLQARRFRTSWESELVRYLVHGVLHLQGHDDLKPAPRRRMKREENRLLRELGHEFDLRKLRRKSTVAA